MASNANSLGINCATNEGISWGNYTNTFVAPVVAWLSNNPTLRPQYVILFQDLPSRFTNASGGTESVQFDLSAGNNAYYTNVDYSKNWTPFVTSINMNGVNGMSDCTAYIKHLTNTGALYVFNQPFLRPNPTTYFNTNWYFNDAGAGPCPPYFPIAILGVQGVEANGVSSSAVTYSPTNGTHITTGANVAGYYSWGADGGLGSGYPSSISFSGASAWYVIATVESYNGQRVPNSGECSFLQWFASNAFGGTSYSTTPIGAISHVDEPYEDADNVFNYFGLWAAGKSFAICAWAGQIGTYPIHGASDFWFQAIGDPFVTK
jgi:hypothetical protein